MKNYDRMGENYILAILQSNGYCYSMLAPSSTQETWDIIAFLKEDNDFYRAVKFQVKSHFWSSKSHVVNANFESIKRDADYLIIVIYKKSKSIPDFYMISTKKIREKKQEEAGLLFGKDGYLLYSMINEQRSDDKQTITIDKLESEENKEYVKLYKNKVLKEKL